MSTHIEWKSLILSIVVTACMTFVFADLLTKISLNTLTASDYIQICNTIGLAYFGIAALFLGYKGVTDIFGKKNSPLGGNENVGPK